MTLNISYLHGYLSPAENDKLLKMVQNTESRIKSNRKNRILIDAFGKYARKSTKGKRRGRDTFL